MSATTKIDIDLEKLREALAERDDCVGLSVGDQRRAWLLSRNISEPSAFWTAGEQAALLGYRSRDAEIESIHEGYKEQIKSLVASAERSQGLAADLRYHLQNRPADLAAKDAEIQQLKTELIMAMDAASKGDLARQTAGGMEMELAAKDAEIAELVEALKSGIKWLDRLDQRRDLIHASFFGGADYDPASSVKEIRTLLIKHGKENS